MPPRQPSRPDRDVFGLASRSSCPPCRHVAAFQTHPPPLFEPRAFFKRLAVYAKLGIMPFHGNPLQKCSPKIGRDVASALVRESASLDTRPITGAATPSKEPEPSPPVTHRIPATIPKAGYVDGKPMCHMRLPLFLSLTRNPRRNAPASCPSLLSPQQRGDEHSRT